MDQPVNEHERPVRTGRRVQVMRVLYGATIVGSALAIGSLHTVVLAVVASVLALATVLGWGVGEPFRARRPATLLLLAAVGLSAWTVLQAVPLPIGLLARIAPLDADTWSRALLALNEPGPAHAPVSLDPIATHVQVLRGICYVMAFLLSVRIANRRQGAVFLECAIGVTGLALAVAGLLHPAFGATKVFGVYAYSPGIEPRHVAPLLNGNHLAAYIDIAFCISLASALSPRPEIPRLVSLTVTAVLVAVELWVASRGGVLAMAVATVLIIALSRTAVGHKRRLATGIALVVIAGAGIGMAVLSSSDEAWHELASFEDTKSAIFRQAMHMATAFPLFGIGRGAFQSVFPAFRTSMGYSDVTHPENVIAQWTCEWGIPAAVIGAALIAWALRPATALWSARPKVVAAVSVVAALLAIVWVLPDASHDVDDDRAALRTAALDPEVSADDFHALAREAMVRHPAEPYFAFSGAVRASRARDESVMPWIEHTLERAQVYGPAHLLIARTLARRSPSQARMEYRYAAEQDIGLTPVCVNEALPLVHGFDDAMEVVPRGPGAANVLELLAEGVNGHLPATRVRLDDEILSRNPVATSPLERRVMDAVGDLEAGEGAPWCVADSAACVQHGEEMIARLTDLEPSRCEPYRLHAQILADVGETQRALDILQRASDRVDDRDVCLAALARLAHQTNDQAREGMALEKLEHAGCGDDAECTKRWLSLGQQHEARGDDARALALYKKILARNPDDDTALASEARVAAALGLHADALEAYTKLARRHPEQPGWASAAEAQRAALFQPKQ
jgi:tetratricopeptide (TPR) repeat protein